ncbi:MAG: deoxyribose-phosphate aldolase [Pseudomonadota bacterium]
MTQPDDRGTARRALGLLDLTNLNDDCSEQDIDALCDRAVTEFGSVAAVCLWPRFVRHAVDRLKGTGVRVASVANFPAGGTDTITAMAEATSILDDGADEVDLVMPYRAYIDGRRGFAETQIVRVREAIGDRGTLKVILETGELADPDIIRDVSEMAIGAGADFIKTSTGKTKVSATPEAITIMLDAIGRADRPVGIKPSGGIRTLADAALYLGLADGALGSGWARPESFRFGASGLLDALTAALEGTAAPAGTASY